MARGSDRLIGVVAGLLGAAGVADSAAAAHGNFGPSLSVAGSMLLIHAVALLALASPTTGSGRLRLIAVSVLTVGIIVFAGDLSLRAIEGTSLFPYAAPLGGMLLIAGWLITALSFAAGRVGDHD
jgi:uncharacterized membrane protein YgdD (TMEM256/DUF423 family)